MTPPALFLGIDGGATSCRARLEDSDGNLLGEGRAGSANPRWGLDAAIGEILLATRQALEVAGLIEADLARTHAGLGLAGTGQARERGQMLAWSHPFRTMTLRTDAHAACLGAHEGGDGAIMIVGTGSCGCAIVDGEETRVGGWGFPASDHGSGAWLGLEAVRRALFAYDGVTLATPFTVGIMKHFGDDPEAIVAFSQSAHPRDWAAFAPSILDAAAGGDRVAADLLREAGRDLGAMTATLRRAGAPTVCLMGGLAGPIAGWLPEEEQPYLAPAKGDALKGAILIARRTMAETGAETGR
ncbi:BadF/BadG/BcrA/BcrD ATPase family protein [Inquilinus sp. CAU 1745]|uniref:BadF/BadG/BcrA/BcrD ATPase family protein n=1 Tax=Inquilinus sp. CAU 1745 TaxID=3140369 RepID=UPI00325B6058